MTISFRQVFKYMVPSWLSSGDSELVLYSLAVMKDAAVERLRLGLEARFPRRAGDSALALIGTDRGIVRGRDETSAHYAERLCAWRYPRGHRVRGSAFALLEQASEYFGGLRAWTIDARGNYHERDAVGVESYSYGNVWDWDGTAPAPQWARFWLGLDVSSDVTIIPWPAVLGAYDNSLVPGRGYTVGHQGISHQDALTIKKLMRGRHPWKPAGTRAEWAIVSFGATLPVPDGSWGSFAGRDPGFRYWNLRTS